MCLGNILKNFTINNRKKIELKGCVQTFSVDYNIAESNNFLDIHIYLMKIT